MALAFSLIECANCRYKATSDELRMASIIAGQHRGAYPRCPQCKSQRWAMHPYNCTCGADHSVSR